MFPAGYFSGFPVVVLLFVFGTSVPLAVGMYGLLQALWLRFEANQQAALSAKDAEFKAGAAVLCGRVSLAEGERIAVRVEVTQRGFQWRTKEAVKHQWEEIDRLTTARPFYVEDTRGHRVRVEPPGDVLVIDRMDHTQPGPEKTRLRTAELSPGEPIYAVGRLVDDADPESPSGRSLVLRADDGEMLLSSEPLADRFDRPAIVNAGFAMVMLVFLLMASAISVPVYGRHFFGQDEIASVQSKRIQVSRSSGRRSGGSSTDYYVKIGMLGGKSAEYEVTRGWYDSLSSGQILAMRSVTGFPGSAELGNDGATHWIVLLLIVGAPVGIATMYVLGLRRTRPWWEAKLVDIGSGSLDRGF